MYETMHGEIPESKNFLRPIVNDIQVSTQKNVHNYQSMRYGHESNSSLQLNFRRLLQTLFCITV